MLVDVENRARVWRGRRRTVTVTAAMAGFLIDLAVARHKKVVADSI